MPKRLPPPPMVSALEHHLGYWLRLVSNHVSHAFQRRVEAHGVTVVEWVVLRLLWDAPLQPSSVAERIGMTRGAVSKIADRLTQKGLILGEQDPTDLRRQTLELTAAGRALVPVLAAAADANDAAFFGHLPHARQALLQALLEDIARTRQLTDVPVI